MNAPTSTADKQASEKIDRLRRADKLSIAAAVGLVLVTLLSCGIFTLQYFEMQTTSDVMRQQYEVMKQTSADMTGVLRQQYEVMKQTSAEMHGLVAASNDLAKATLTSSEKMKELARAKLTVDHTETKFYESTGMLQYTVVIKNVSQTTASNPIWFAQEEILQESELRATIGKSDLADMNNWKATPGFTLWIEPGASESFNIPSKYTVEKKQAILKNRKLAVYIFGGVRYDDTDNQSWYLHFCYHYNLQQLQLKMTGDRLDAPKCDIFIDSGKLISSDGHSATAR